MSEISEHPYATLLAAALFLAFILFFSLIGGVLFYWFGWTDSIFELSKWAMGAILIATFFGLVAAVFDWILGVNDK
jgi:hypothetical protein